MEVVFPRYRMRQDHKADDAVGSVVEVMVGGGGGRKLGGRRQPNRGLGPTVAGELALIFGVFVLIV